MLRSGGSTNGFDPRAIGGCLLWLDGKDSNTMVLSGSNVLTWKDKTMFQQDASAVVAPTYTSNGLVFNGTQWMTLPDGTFPYGNSSYSVFAVVSATLYNSGSTSGGTVFSAGNTSINTNGIEGKIAPGAITHTWGRTGPTTSTVQFSNPSIFTYDIPVVLGWTYTSFRTGRNMYVNGRLAGNVTSTGGIVNRQSTPTYNRIGADRLLLFYIGRISEFLVYDSDLQTQDRTQLEGYLAWKWGIQSNSIGFTPTDIPNCIGWWDANDTATITVSGTSVTQWNDKGSLNVPFISTGTLIRSSNYSNVMNNRNVILTPGTAGNFMRTSQVIPPTTTIFVACCPVTSTTSNVAIFEGVRMLRYTGANPSSNLSVFTNLGSTLIGQSDPVFSKHALKNMLYVAGVADLSTSYTSYNGAHSRGNSALNSNQWSNPGIGGGGGNPFVYFSQVYYGEIIVYNMQLSPTDIRRVEGYMRAKWAIDTLDTLPTSHPNSSIPPYTSQFSELNDISGCKVWIDAADNSTLTFSGSQVTAVRNKGGNVVVSSNILTSAIGATTLGNINGIQSLRFAGTSMFTNVGPAPAVNNSDAVFIVASVESATSGNVLFDFGSRRATLVGSLPSPLIVNASVGSTGTTNRTLLVSSNQPFLLSMISDLSACRVSINGVRCGGDISAALYTGSSNLFLGGIAGAASLNGNIGECLIVGPTPTLHTQAKIEAYLLRKWKIQSNIATPVSIPTDVSGCVVWLDAADGSTVTTSGTQATSWRDKSSNAYSFTTTAGPQYITDGTRNIMRWDGATTLFFSNTTASIPADTHTLIVVQKPTSTANGLPAFRYGSVIPTVSLNNIQYARDAAVGIGNNLLSRTIFADYEILTALINVGDQKLYRDGSLMSGMAVDLSRNQTSVGLWIGRIPASGTTYVGNICEMIAYDRTINAETLNNIHQYLGNKWGIKVCKINTSTMNSMIPMRPAFYPTVVNGLNFWLDGADPTTMTFSNNIVMVWSNKVRGVGNAVRGPVVHQGAYDSNLRGTPGQFPTPAYMIDPSSCSIYMVINLADVTNAISNSNIMRIGSLSTLEIVVKSGNVGWSQSGNNPATQAISANVRSVVSLSLNSATGVVTAGVNGNSLRSQQVVSVYPNMSGGFISIANGGLLHELLHYNVAHTSEERQKLEGYLAWKWNISANLPISHPYKNVRPL